ncbi:MAG: putative redox protein [Bacteroidia bacterium]|jgi:putative redox protein
MSNTSTVTYLGDLRTEAIHVKSQHAICTDAPTDNQGKGALFSPTDLMATSLASCMLTVMGIAARAHGIPFEHISSEVTKVMASNPRRISEIQVEMVVNQDWSVDQKKRLERVALACPVAKSLSPSIKQHVNFRYTT